MTRDLLTLSLGLLVGIILAPVASAQQTTGVPGLPSSTTTIDGRQIPPPPGAFGGTINLDALNSTPFWQPQVVPPKGAPNILLIITDDVGFAAPSTFGGVIPTPTLDRIANMGLRYTQFHTTSLCSPTRAALITGRNHHSVGLWRDQRSSDRLSRLQQHYHQGQGDHRPDSQGQRLCDLLVSARTTTRPHL